MIHMPLKILPLLRPAFRAIAGALLTLGLLAGCSKEKKQDRLLESADKYFDAGEYDKTRLEELSKSSPSRPPGTSPPHPSPSARATFPPPRTT